MRDTFYIYELIMYICVSIVLGTTCLLIMPFIDLYTKGINDINYHNAILAGIMLMTVFTEICHIPSGQIIQMSGDFRTSRNIQLSTFAILLIGMFVGRKIANLYGILIAVMVASFVLSILEIWYTGHKILNRNWMKLVINTVACFVICGVATLIGFSGRIVSSSYFEFAIEGIFCVTMLSAITLIVYYFIDHKSTMQILGILSNTIKMKMKCRK